MSVLQQMTKDIMTPKATKAAGLTPVAGETGMTVAAMAQVIPNDLPGRFMSSEDLGLAAASLREHAATLIATADAIDALIDSNARRSPTVDAKATAAAAKKAAEQEADRKAAAADEADGGEPLKDRLERLSAEAQAAVFTAADDDGTTEAPASGWVCPDHGAKDLSTVTPRKGDPYIMCGVGDCEYFER